MFAPAGLVVPITLGLVIFVIIERIVSAILSLFLDGGGQVKHAMSMQFLLSIVDSVVQTAFSLVYAVANTVSSIFGSLFWAAALLTLGAVFYITYEHSPEVWTGLVRAYNAYFGPFIHYTVIGVMDFISVIFKGLIPIYNSVFYVKQRLINGYLIPLCMDSELTIFSFGLNVFNAMKNFCFSAVDWMRYASDCPASNGDACYDVATRTIDLITPMRDIRGAVLNFVTLSHKICGSASAIVDAATYPFMDVNLASGIHHLANGFLYLFFHLPQVTYTRCIRHGGEEPLMCTPDLDPVFSFLSAGLRDLGYLVNNWVNIIFVIIQSFLGWGQISCESVLAPFASDPGQLKDTLFGKNQTAIVGLTGWLMAVTDGYAVAYQGQGNTRVTAWPRPINISHGVAAVTFGRSSDYDATSLSASASGGTSTSLFGCSCVSYGERIQIQCSIVPFGGLLGTESGNVPVYFQMGSVIERTLKCYEIDITVQSVRWPATRFTTNGQGKPVPDCTISRTCNKVDASLWVVPRAGCDSESTLCDCYPFCLAVRQAGSQTASMVLYSAEQWRSKVYVIQRDCNIHSLMSSISAANAAVTVTGAVSSSGVTTVQASLDGSAPQFVGLGDVVNSSTCIDNIGISSLINRTIHPAYDSPTPAFLRNTDTPFVISGDTMLTSVKHGDGSYTVRVERLTGASGNEFTISVVSYNFPAYPPPNVPAALFKQYPKDHLTVPYARMSTLAVSSRAFVFYAVNPAIEVYDAYLHYCRNKGDQIDQFGIIMVSSYSPIRIWRVDAYRRCTISGCGPNLVSQVDLPDAFSNGTVSGTSLSYECEKSYNEAIVQLEYVNEFNIAITVRHTDVKASFVDYRIYWLHVETMQLSGPGLARQGPWNGDISMAAYSVYSLCPAMQRLPEFGSVAAELIIAGVFLIKMPVDAVIYFPGIIKLWSKGSVCPLQTRGHSILEQCGMHAFSLDDFFGSLQTASNILWSSLSIIAGAIHELNPTPIEFVENVLNGATRYGQGSIDLWTTQYQVISMMKAGPSTVMSTMPTEVWLNDNDVGKMSELAQGSMKLSGNSLGWARFGWACMVKIVVTITQNVLMGKSVDVWQGWLITVNSLDEMRDYFDSYVVDNMRQSCAGLSLMLGLNNPWSVFIYQQCIAANTVVESGIDVFLSVFNLAPFAQCMCSTSAGKVFGEYALRVCVPRASATLRPVLLDMVQTAKAGRAPKEICTKMLQYTKTELNNAVQPWFDAQYSSMSALASSIDYALAWFDSSSGKCLDFQGDPYVVVLMPFPTDYFHACASTSLCRSKCSAVWNEFDKKVAAVATPSHTETVTVKAESLFFPVLSADSFTPMKIFTLLVPASLICEFVCGNAGDNCVAIAGVTEGVIRVQYYCAPVMVSASIYRTLDSSVEWTVSDSKDWSDNVIKIQFADANGYHLTALTSTGSIYMASRKGTVEVGSIDLFSDKLDKPVLLLNPMVTIFNIHRQIAAISVNVFYREMDNRITAKPLHFVLMVHTSTFPLSDPTWMSTGDNSWSMKANTQFFDLLHGYEPSLYEVTIDTSKYIALPTEEAKPVGMLTVKWDSNGIILEPAPSFELRTTPIGIGSLLTSGQALSQNCKIDSEGSYVAFSAAPEYRTTMWLSQVRITDSYASTFVSQPVYLSVETVYNCDVNSCLGCPDGEIQRLCDAVQQCTVVNCIGTPVNMRRVLCQVGQSVADQVRETLALLNGVWVVFVDTFMMVMDLSLQKGIKNYDITWPDDRFFGYICTVKDNNAHIISIVTSALNSVLQLGNSAIVYLTGRAHDIDSNFNAMATLPLTALTNFMNQLFLFPLYPLIIAQKIMMCRTNGVLAIFDVTGFTLRVGKAQLQDASDIMVGMCLSSGSNSQMSNPTDSSNSNSVSSIVSQVFQSAALAVLPKISFQGTSIEYMQHMLDGTISYLMGVVSGMEDVVQSLDMAHCKLPDYSLKDTVFCACGDTPYAIPAARKSEGIDGLGLWCTGTLSLVDATNSPYIVYNPFTYSELQILAGTTDAYLSCASDKLYVNGDPKFDCHGLRPAVQQLAAQGVSVLTVLTACKSNYMKRQWDPSAYVLFDESAFSDLVYGIGRPDLSHLSLTTQRVGACLADPVTRNTCLQDFLQYLNTDAVLYWKYEDVETKLSPQIDACQVFTGPANNSGLDDSERSVFRACLDHYSDSNCQLSSSLWTPQSDNVVPVAYTHAVKVNNPQRMDMLLQLKYQQAYDLVHTALAAVANYNNNNVISVFFSPEGDIMHQMMDCIFMGPYSKVNYWPWDSMGILPIPQWYRDTNGTTRSVDPRECVKTSIDKEPPYSCGSPTRQAVIKYFFRDYLPKQQEATISSIVQAMVRDINSSWNTPLNYPCLCSDGRTHHISCCTLNSSSWLPPNLEVIYQTLPVNHIFRALTVQLRDFYRFALEDADVWTRYLDSATLESYNWSTREKMATVSKQEAIFSTHKPTMRYDETEINSPFADKTALWEQCHGLLSQLIFTIPMATDASGQWVTRNLPEKLEGTDGLNAFVKSAVTEAMQFSPLYRHYNVSFVPSDSRMCASYSISSPVQKLVKVSNFVVNSAVLLDTSTWSTLPAYGTNSFPMSACFCGWEQSNGYCQVPSQAICSKIPSVCPKFSMQSRSAVDAIKALWDPSWPCRSLLPSDHWGVLNYDQMDAWLKGDVSKDFTISGEDLLRYGRGGLRVGSFQNINDQTKASVLPNARVMEPNETLLTFCKKEADAVPGTGLLDTTPLKAFVSRLFPVAQGVYEPGTVSYCLRYIIEVALLRAMELVSGQWDASAGPTYAQQELVVEQWRGKCESQISLLALCKNLDIFKPPLNIHKRGSWRRNKCPFIVSMLFDNDVYLTPGCLVHKAGFFYDPCKCPSFSCNSETRPVFNSFIDLCKIPFDPRDMTIDAPLGGWTISPLEVLKPTFASSILLTPKAVGNIPSGSLSWKSAEGYLSDTGLFCDMLADWWPVDQTLPVGYHATVPCRSEEAGYRTFDSAFAVERSGSGTFTVVKLVYQHDATRDAAKIDTHFGSGGVCRASNLGIPFYETNMMRICTRQPTGDDSLDPAVPVDSVPTYSDSSYGAETCSTSSTEVPWYDMTGRYDAALYSVGTVPNMPRSGTTDYPQPDSDMYFGVGPQAQILSDLAAGGKGWGDGCSDFAIKECSADSECPADFYCQTEAKVCLSVDFKNKARCYRHDMCGDAGMMCNGAGKCEQGYIYYLNTLNSSVEASVFSEQCDESTSDTYSTHGSSPWEYVPDWLASHGMCSNKNWFMYSKNLINAQSLTTCQSGYCTVDSQQCKLPFGNRTWWASDKAEPNLFAVKPTVCDRDYEHMLGPTQQPLMGCSPKQSSINSITDNNDIVSALSFAKLFRNFKSGHTELPVMPKSSLKRTGFLGFDESLLTKSTVVNCQSFQNCYAAKFTFNGVEQGTRTYWENNANKIYDQADIFRCGVIGYYNLQYKKCRLDLKVLPLYVAFCKNPAVLNTCTCGSFSSSASADPVGCSPVINKAKTQSICDNILEEYTADYTVMQSNNRNLQDLFNVFYTRDQSLAAYVTGTECFEAIHQSMVAGMSELTMTPRYYTVPAPVPSSPVGIYYPFEFVLYEVPIGWIHQCIRVGGLFVNSDSRKIICSQQDNSKTLTWFNDISKSNQENNDFDKVMASYRRKDTISGFNSFKQYISSAFPDVSDVVDFSERCRNMSVTPCQMRQYCAKKRNWISNTKMDIPERNIIASLYRGVCGGNKNLFAFTLEGYDSLEQFINKNTYLTNFELDMDSLNDLSVSSSNNNNNVIPSMESFILKAILQCPRVLFNISIMQPLHFTFNVTTAALAECMSLKIEVDKYDLQLLSQGSYNNADYNFMPRQQDTEPAPLDVDDVKDPNQRACVFPNLLQQNQFYSLDDPDPSPCDFVNFQCNQKPESHPVSCIQYPLTYIEGNQACGYPTSKQYTSLLSHIQYMWMEMRGQFQDRYTRKLASETFVFPAPYEPLFFQLSTASFPNWQFDTTAARTYLSNIHPDTTKEVMCTMTSATDIINFTVCNDPNYATLRAHTDRMRAQASPILPAGKQLKWKVSRDFLQGGALFAFAGHDRNDSDVLLQSIFNQETRCGLGEMQYNRVCLLSGTGNLATKVHPWVPWLSGQWNPYEMCDIRLLEISQGYQEEIWPYDLATCPQCSIDILKNSAGTDYITSYMFDSQSPTCDSRQNTYAKQVDVEPNAPTNLCYISRENSEKECTRWLGMAGGGRGMSILNHPFVPHLYGYTNFSGKGGEGIFPRSSGLFNGSVGLQYGFLSVPADELGLVAIGFSVNPPEDEGDQPLLKVAKIPLQSQTGFMSVWATKAVDEWVPVLATVFASDDALHTPEQSSRINSAWDCPLRRAAFYSQGLVHKSSYQDSSNQDSSSYFSPAIPSPGRARRIFSALTGGLSSHPTQELQRDGAVLGSYITSNGFCFCPAGMSSVQQHCSIGVSTPVSDPGYDCSLKRTIDALKGSWVTSHVFDSRTTTGGPSTCKMQMDWPYLKGTLRDGTLIDGDYTLASDPLSQKCHILDRLRPFQYRYKSVSSMPRAPGSTLDKGGVCHTGRAATLTPEATAKINGVTGVTATRCVKESESSDGSGIVIACEDGSKFSLAKERSKPLNEMVEAVSASRTKCNTCSAPPTFTNAKRDPIPSESSFGIPFRFSAARAVAADLQRMICGSNSTCQKGFNMAAWSQDSFLSNLISSPDKLFVSPQTIISRTVTQAGAETPLNPTPWDTEWVFCNNTVDLRAGKCYGSITETQWRTDRFQSCHKTIREMTRNNPDVMSSVDVCLMDANLQNLCVAVSKAQTLVREANCLASGSDTCALKPFMYQPATWDVSNQEFVHQTVTRFYTRVNSYVCPSVVETVRANNQAILNRCKALPLGALNIALQGCREIVNTIAQVIFYVSSILIDGLLIPFVDMVQKENLKLEIVYLWNSLQEVIADLIKVLSDLFFDMLFHMGALGIRIYSLTQKACSAINTAFRYWLSVWCVIAIDIGPQVLGGLRQVAEFCESAFSVLDDALNVLFEFLVPDALSLMVGMGYDKTFKDKQKAKKEQEKQVISDKLKASKSEGKALDTVSKDKKNFNLNKFVIGKGKGSPFNKRMVKKILTSATGFIGMLGTVGMVASMFMDIGSAVYDAVEASRLADLYPDEWTFFDFGMIYVVIDTLEYFLTTNQECLTYRASGETQAIDCSFPSLLNASSHPGALDLGTRCWADVQRDVGTTTSNLLACTPSDTCYRTITDLTPLVCASCPDIGEGFSQFGCSPLLKTCVCSVNTLKTTSCTSNEQCIYSTSTCSLVTGLDDMSYGNEPCTHCTKDVQCLMRGGDSVGQCACVFQSKPLQQCSENEGNRVSSTKPDATCGYLVHGDPTVSMATAYWGSIGLVQCRFLRPDKVYCSRVYKDSGYVKMAVGISMSSVSSTFQSRRLLMSDEILPEETFEIHSAESEYTLTDSEAMHNLLLEDWNRTASPCSDLVAAYQQAVRGKTPPYQPILGPLDNMYLRQCVYWRYVGRRTVERYNLTSLKNHDSFLLSIDDFAAALTKKSVLLDLIHTPEALVFALGHSPLLKPIYASFLVMRSFVFSRSNAFKWGLSFNLTDWKFNLSKGGGWNSSGLPDPPLLHEMWDRAWISVREMPLWLPHTRPPRKQKRYSVLAEESMKNSMNTEEKSIQDSNFSLPARNRQLLQKTTINVADTWLSGSFSWPPNYYTTSQYRQCGAGMELILILRNVFSVLANYYQSSDVPLPPTPVGLWDNLPHLSVSSNVSLTSIADSMHNTTQNTNWSNTDTIVRSLYQRVSDFWGVKADTVRAFFSDTSTNEGNVYNLYTSLLKCDYPSVQYCSRRSKDLFFSFILMILLNIIVAYYAKILQVPFASVYFMLFFFPILFWYVYGMALTCAPMIPTCLLDDILRALNYVLPKQMDIPTELQISPNCLSDPSATVCMKSCSSDPLGFLGWRDTLAWGLCDINVAMCLRVADSLQGWDSLSDNIRRHSLVASSGSESVVSASRFCFTITFVTIIPILILSVLVISSLPHLLYLPCMLIPKFVTIALQSLAFTHAGDDGSDTI